MQPDNARQYPHFEQVSCHIDGSDSVVIEQDGPNHLTQTDN
jgi:hypothetical protein